MPRAGRCLLRAPDCLKHKYHCTRTVLAAAYSRGQHIALLDVRLHRCDGSLHQGMNITVHLFAPNMNGSAPFGMAPERVKMS